MDEISIEFLGSGLFLLGFKLGQSGIYSIVSGYREQLE